MRFFADTKIGHRLGAGFALTLGLMVIIVITGIVCLRGISRQLEEIVLVDKAKLRYAANIRTAFADITYLLGQVASSQDPTLRQEAKAKIDRLRTGYQNAVKGLETLETTGKGKSLIAALKKEVAKGKQENNGTIELGMSGNTKQATQKFEKLTGILRGYIQAADALVDYNEQRIMESYEEARRKTSKACVVFTLLGVANLLIGIWLSHSITRSITLPLLRSSSHIDLMAKGDFSIPVSEHALRRGDEMGIFARSMDSMNSNLGHILEEAMSSSAGVASASAQLHTTAQKLSQGAGEQVTMAAQVATASTEMNQASEGIALNTNNIASSASETVRIAKGGQEIVESAIHEVNIIAQTVETASQFVKQLGTQSEKIGDIVTAINEIADQTNLLALNAAIEAARAGEHGRGFAVVADEVRKLAERTASSTTEIGDMIDMITQGVKMTVDSMDTAKEKVVTGVRFSSQAQTALQDIISSITNLHDGIHQVATAIEELNATTDEITRDMTRASDATRESLSLSEEIAGASAGLSGLAQNLERVVQSFKL
jgi:methyl-accepting chemotaxis protein